MKLALAMIVRGADDEAKVLDRCLESLAGHVDGIFITRTHKPGEQPNEAVKKVALKYKAHVSEFVWVNDFAAARNFNFAQVPPEYTHIMWTDADDVWRGAEDIKATIEKASLTDAFGFWYLYDWDEHKKPTVVHRKTMIIKNDGCATWVGKIHEDLLPNRNLDTKMVEGIERLHLTDETRVKRASERNLQIAEIASNDGDDPRNYWNLANAYSAVADTENAIKWFNKFIHATEADEEKYLARCRLADAYKGAGRLPEAIEQLQMAIGMFSHLPDAYFQLAYLFYSNNNLDKAEEYCLAGLVRKPQVHKMIVFNPRDYDYNPMMLLAQTYYQKNRPDLMLPLLEGCLKIYPNDELLKTLVAEGKDEKERLRKALEQIQKLQKITDTAKLKKAIDKLPTEIRSHPAVAALRNKHFIKTESSGKDLVIYCGFTTHEWNPETFKTKGVGGSEEAVIYMAREYAKLGWNVTVYNNCGHKELKDDFEVPIQARKGTYAEISGCVTYRPFWEWNYRDKQDVTILWRWSKPLDAEINCDKIFVDLHDVVPAGEFTPARLAKVSKIFVKTEAHRVLFPNVPDEKIAIIPNGMDMTLLDNNTKRDPYLLINTSSPDRSMDVLPELFARVKEQVPKAKMQWAYGFDNFKSSVHANDPKKIAWMKERIAKMKEVGIENMGRLSQAEVAKMYRRGSILAYPTEFYEIDCISVKKAQAAGCWVVSTDFAALPESVKFGDTVHSEKTKDNWAKPYQYRFGLESKEAQDEWVAKVVERLKAPQKFDPTEWRKQYTWESVAKRWNEILCA